MPHRRGRIRGSGSRRLVDSGRRRRPAAQDPGAPQLGEQKARIFVGLFGKQLDVTPAGWEDAAGKFGQPDTYISIADIVDAESLGRVRAYKQQLKAAARAGEELEHLLILANGDPVELPDGAHLIQLFDALGVGAHSVVAEVNGEAVDRAQPMEAFGLTDGDRVEIVRAVAGG